MGTSYKQQGQCQKNCEPASVCVCEDNVPLHFLCDLLGNIFSHRYVREIASGSQYNIVLGLIVVS